MITDDEVMRLFERADPARTADVAPTIDTSRYLDALLTRSNDMTIIESTTTTTPEEPTSPRKWSMIALAAAAVAVILVGGLVVASRDESAPPVNDQLPLDTQPAEIESNAAAVEVARGFVEAFGAFEADQALSYMADDAKFSGVLTQSSSKYPKEELRTTIPDAQSMGFQQIIDECVQRETTAAGTIVRCTFDFHYLLSDELGLGPFSGSFFDLTVLDGQIVDLAGYCEIEEFSPQVWDPFATWLSAAYPKDAAAMLGDGGGLDGTELMALWEQRLQEYVEVAGQ